LFVSPSIYRTSSDSCCGLRACLLTCPASLGPATPLHRRPRVDRSTPCFSATSFNVNCSSEPHDFRSSIASSIGAMILGLSRVGFVVLRRALVFCGAHCESGHTAHGHVTERRKRPTDCGKTYSRSLLDPTPVMLQRLAVPPLSLATAEDGPQYFSRPGCGLAAQSIYDVANHDRPAYYVYIARIAPWTVFRAQQASSL
jgi:hypothetical protein